MSVIWWWYIFVWLTTHSLHFTMPARFTHSLRGMHPVAVWCQKSAAALTRAAGRRQRTPLRPLRTKVRGPTQTGYEPKETQTLKAKEAKGKKRAEKAHDDGATTKSSWERWGWSWWGGGSAERRPTEGLGRWKERWRKPGVGKNSRPWRRVPGDAQSASTGRWCGEDLSRRGDPSQEGWGVEDSRDRERHSKRRHKLYKGKGEGREYGSRQPRPPSKDPKEHPKHLRQVPDGPVDQQPARPRSDQPSSQNPNRCLMRNNWGDMRSCGGKHRCWIRMEFKREL